jgi:protein tyrosine phosphatase (PTP) superfamily phosphohydrolase (DUF442 family)
MHAKERAPRRAFVRTSLVGLIGVSVALLGWPFLPFGHRIRVVEPGELVRSAALPPETLRACIRANGIRCVVSLRRKGSDDDAARAEPKVCAEEGVEYVQIPLNTTKLPPAGAVSALVHRLIDGPRPILVHCDHGVDRSGLASVLYEVCVRGESLARAREKELSWSRGHVALWQGGSIDRFFDLYAANARGLDLACWIDEEYPKLREGELGTLTAGSAGQ